MATASLFDPVRLGELALPNRIVMAPMTRNRASGTIPGERNVRYYAQRVTAGLIVTEATQVTPRGVGYPDTPGIHNDAQVHGWQLVTEAVHRAGGRIALQLWHCGRISHSSYHGGLPPVSASAVRPAGRAATTSGPQPLETPHALTGDEIREVIAAYADGARRAKLAGFDAVEIHGANGYLIDQFLQSGTNHRTDEWGGSIERRARFLFEVTRAVIDAFGPQRVGVRLSPGGSYNDMHDEDPVATFGHAAAILGELPCAYVHVVEAQVAGQSATDLVRSRYRGPLISAGGYDRATAIAAIEAGRADAIGFARHYISNPDLVERLHNDWPLAPSDRKTYYGGSDAGYSDYPAYDPGAAPVSAR
ncbi:MAG TPA: alkene reductase [Kofleriaceae bacterium]|jgi:N-ethylmaleimide reductase|nr:alkene reductase [Kofleriaceae bacterium]